MLESKESIMTTAAEEARLALMAKGTAEQNLARLSLCPPWRHAAFAAVMAATVATPACQMPLRFVPLVLILLAVALIVRSDRRRLGVFINGYRRGKTRLVTFPMLAVILVFYAASSYFGDMRHQPAISMALAIAAFGIGYGGSVIWQRVFVRELGARRA
jgi:hypothetical protein